MPAIPIPLTTDEINHLLCEMQGQISQEEIYSEPEEHDIRRRNAIWAAWARDYIPRLVATLADRDRTAQRIVYDLMKGRLC